MAIIDVIGATARLVIMPHSPKAATVCLNMIVKDESHVIHDSLANVAPLIDHWVIVDTGSTDGTQDIIRKTLSDIPGELHERPWKNFGHNRSEAIALAAGKADYILTIDADETLARADDFEWGPLGADAYMIPKRRSERVYPVVNLVRDGLDWRWHGVLHEHLECADAAPAEHLDTIEILSPRRGARAHDPKTYQRDAAMLETALIDEPENARYVFYLAQSCRDAQNPERAMIEYERRVAMGGWREEVYISLLNIARMLRDSGAPTERVTAAYLRAFEAEPQRAEALYDLGVLHGERAEWACAWLYLERALALPYPRDLVLFIENDIYTWRAKLEGAVAAHNSGHYERALALNDDLLAGDALTPPLRELVEKNRALSLSATGGV